MRSAIYLVFIILLYMGIYLPAEGQIRPLEAIDSLKTVLRYQKPDTNKALTYVRICEHYINIGDVNNSFLYGDSALSLSKKLSFERIEASALENLGVVYMRLNKLDSAKRYFSASINKRRKIGDKRGIAQSYNTMGMFYQNQDSLPEALENFYISLKNFEEIDNKEGISLVRNFLSQIYLAQGNDSEALKNVQIASDIKREGGDYSGAANLKWQMGNIEFNRQNYEIALKYFLEVFQMINESGTYYVNLGDVYMQIGDVYQKLGDVKFSKGDQPAAFVKYRQAMAMYDSTNRIFSEKNDSDYVDILGVHIAKIFIKYKQFSKARNLLNKVIERFGKSNNTDIADTYASLSFLDSAEGNYKKAFLEYKMYIGIRDSVYNSKNDKRLFRAMMQHDYDAREADAKLLQAKKDAETRESRNKQNLAIFSLAILIVAVFAIALIQWRNNKAKQKANKLLESTLSDLKSTQMQLIQSEKLASLGELTAGIAHEIQNPLNFVNNFSEVNKDLLSEMKDEMDKGNITESRKIANDVIENEEKISHHGKRADAIVKGMLQHSRAGTGQKEPTDINALADEYLLLSYHGLRAKEKSFNATLKKDYEPTIGKINIVPQDIGRVLLNLYNNAFYAVNERNNELAVGYEPTVSVSTKKTGNSIEVRVRDNGNGIPQGVLDKIFNPFFTTKPTGQGTGLGLSMSYDIVKAHGGELKVERKGGDGAEFVVQIPAV